MKVILALFFLSFTLYSATPDVSKFINTTQQKIPIEDKFDDDLEDEFDDEFDDEEIVVNDPFSSYNRTMTYFNDVVYMNVLIPVSTGYSKVVPVVFRQGFSNMFDNLIFPVRFVNNILQLKFDNALEETGRFLVNSTLGLLGFFDPAKEELEWQAHNEDFGQTLGFYGVG
ncbi:MAG: VacJ family lipoprotein, partial [Campylobacteraceae bacterium]|nr:VacJ family lipoprotein [Campylobacteraceae bacterium]